MFIRQTNIKSRPGGDSYFTFRLVESFREGKRVRQRTLLNLGTHFDVPRQQWPALVQQIEQLLGSQQELLLPTGLDAAWLATAEQLAAQLQHAISSPDTVTKAPDLQSVDVTSLELLRPRQVGIEHLALSAMQAVGFDKKLAALGLNGRQCSAAIGNVIGRMAAPASELATWQWLKNRTALGELMDVDYSKLSLMSLYRATDVLYQHKTELESFLYQQERSLFGFDEVITLYDLTNTYFEGTASANSNAAFGRSKEKRSDCRLVTLAIVLDSSGFPRRSEILPGNVSEAGTLEKMLETLDPPPHQVPRPTVVLDAGIATEANIAWLVAHQYYYLVVSRKRKHQFNPEHAEIIRKRKDGEAEIQIERVMNPENDEVQLYCYSAPREEKERAMQSQASGRFEKALSALNDGLSRKRTTKQYDKILLRVGRLKQRYPSASQYYDIEVDHDPDSGLATVIRWQRHTSIEHTLPGVYCLRSNQIEWATDTLWRTYTLLTDLESVFRSLKSELGLRPVFHQKTDRVSSHLFISVLAYHLVHNIRFRLKRFGINLSWQKIREIMATQQRVTAQLKRADGRTLHIRKSTRAEHEQLVIYNALGISANPGHIEKVII